MTAYGEKNFHSSWSSSPPRRISRLPAWFAGPTMPFSSIRSMNEAAQL
jgi:hypothetical protein